MKTVQVVRSSEKGNPIYPCRISFESDVERVDGQHVVYGLKDVRNGEIYYVGKTCQILKRLSAHCKVRPTSKRHSALDKRKMSIFADGMDTVCVILNVCCSSSDADEWEQRQIDRRRSTLLNVQLNKWKTECRYE